MKRELQELGWKGLTIAVSGDYKRRRDPTCLPFEPVPCDVFVTEATFGLPVFRHPDAAEEVRKVLRSIEQFPERTHLIGAYALGKAQRIICLLREAGWDRTIYVHGAFERLDFMVVQDIFFSETCRYADVVLPASPALEKDGTFSSTERRIQRLFSITIRKSAIG